MIFCLRNRKASRSERWTAISEGVGRTAEDDAGVGLLRVLKIVGEGMVKFLVLRYMDFSALSSLCRSSAI